MKHDDKPVWTPIAEQLASMQVAFAGINGNRVCFVVIPPYLRVASNEEKGPDCQD